MARRRGHALGRTRQRGHAPTDPGCTRVPGLARVAGTLADTSVIGGRFARRSGARMGSTRLPASGLAAARHRGCARRPARWRGPRLLRRIAGASGHWLVHRRSSRDVRVRTAARRAGYECPTRACSRTSWPRRCHDKCAKLRRADRSPRPRADRGSSAPQHCRHGARRTRLHGAVTTLLGLPAPHLMRLAAGWATARPVRPTAADLCGHRSASTGTAARGAPRQR